MFYVYVLLSENFNRTYTGMTTDLEKRLKQHNSKYTKSTKLYVPWVLIYDVQFNTRIEARAREKYIKSGIGREYVKSIVNNWLRSSTG